MGQRFHSWQASSLQTPSSYGDLTALLYSNREFSPTSALDYGDHGLQAALEAILAAIRGGKRIALYADYDVDGTMSCVSWIWFLQALGYDNFTYYIPDRFSEGYGVNLAAIQHLVRDKGAELIITMDTGITANTEAAWCKAAGVTFICTDHHLLQLDKMPDCIVLNPKLHPDPMYQELCGCGITFVLLRRLAAHFSTDLLTPKIWTDLVALAGMATICDVVPLNGVNHRLAQLGVAALLRSERAVLKRLLRACSVGDAQGDETDVGFRLGPRINAVGRLDHAERVIRAFIHCEETEELIGHMDRCNEQRKGIQAQIFREAREQALQFADQPILFLGGPWHRGVVGIAASKLVEEFWKPTWLFEIGSDGMCKGSARSFPGFDVTAAMTAAKDLFQKFGGHRAAGGFAFPTENLAAIRGALGAYAEAQRQQQPELWRSSIAYDCTLPLGFLDLELTRHLDGMRPFGHGFRPPLFRIHAPIDRVAYYRDKQTGEKKHTVVHIKAGRGSHKILFFNAVYSELEGAAAADFLVSASRNVYQGQASLSLFGNDFLLQ